MHLSLLLIALVLAWAIRCCWWPSINGWCDRWQAALTTFLLPPFLLLTSAIAVLWMGCQGTMWGMAVGQLGYLAGLFGVGVALAVLFYLGWQGQRSLAQIRTYPSFHWQQTQGHLLDTHHLFAAQVGFWRPILVVSQGLLHTLDDSQLQAVFTHEAAHIHYRDTFWFFWLGWVKRLTFWLPNTDELWQELLLLRELRADAWAADRIDPLLLADTLLLMVLSPLQEMPGSVAFNGTDSNDGNSITRIEERINQLLTHQPCIRPGKSLGWLGLCLGLLPLLTILLHT